MSMFSNQFSLIDMNEQIDGQIVLHEKIAYFNSKSQPCFFRKGRVTVRENEIDVVLYSSPATSAFMYLNKIQLTQHLAQIIGLQEDVVSFNQEVWLPGQLILGAERTQLAGASCQDIFQGAPLLQKLGIYGQDEIMIIPIVREGLKFQLPLSLHNSTGYYCDEIVADIHHIINADVPIYGRSAEVSIFKDRDISREQKKRKRLAIIGDSVASGIVILKLFDHIKSDYDKLDQYEIISPFATLRGVARIAKTIIPGIQIRFHIFETLLNALPPDYYYSAYFKETNFHINTELYQKYRDWWGVDLNGEYIADTACAGYGWGEVFFNPRKQIEMINAQLQKRHLLNITDIINRNIKRR